MIDKAHIIAIGAAAVTLSSCGLGAPRDEGYFRFHAEEARLVVTRCERGQETGSDCMAAAQAVAAMDQTVAGAPAKMAR